MNTYNMKIKLLKKVRSSILIKHHEKGTILCSKDYSFCCLIRPELSLNKALLLHFVIGSFTFEGFSKTRTIRNNKRIFQTIHP